MSEDVSKAIRGEGKFAVFSAEARNGRLDTIETWLSSSSTKEELERKLDTIGEIAFKQVPDDGAAAFEADILRDLLIRQILKKP